MPTDLLISISAALGVAGVAGAMIKASKRARARTITARLGDSQRSADQRSSWFEPLGGRISSGSVGATLEGYAVRKHPTITFTDFLTWMLVGAMAGGIVGWGLLGGGLLTLVGVVGGPIVADRLLARSGGRRATRVEHELPAAIRVQIGALRAGRSLTQSLTEVAREASGPLGDEVARSLRQMQLGASLGEVLDDLADRIDSRDVQLWVTAMQIHRRVGGNLIPLLEGLADKLRDRVRLRGEVRAMTAQGRLSGIIVAAAPLAFLGFLSVAAEAQLEILFTTPAGLGLLSVALILEGLGFLWIRRILRVHL